LGIVKKLKSEKMKLEEIKTKIENFIEEKTGQYYIVPENWDGERVCSPWKTAPKVILGVMASNYEYLNFYFSYSIIKEEGVCVVVINYSWKYENGRTNGYTTEKIFDI